MSPMYHRLRAYASLRIFIFKLRRVGRGEELKLWRPFALHPPFLEFLLGLIGRFRGRWRYCEWSETAQQSGLLPCVPSATIVDLSEAMLLAMLEGGGPMNVTGIRNDSYEGDTVIVFFVIETHVCCVHELRRRGSWGRRIIRQGALTFRG